MTDEPDTETRRAFVDALAFQVELVLAGEPKELGRELMDADYDAINSLIDSGDLTADQLHERGSIDAETFAEMRAAQLELVPNPGDALLVLSIEYDEVLARVVERALARRRRG